MMYPNLLGQKAYHRMSNEDMAKVIGVSRKTYENKTVNGKFTAEECKKFCIFFKKSFEYLFATDGANAERKLSAQQKPA